MAQKSMQDLFNEELEDLYDAEKQIVNALPKVAEPVASEELRDALEEHLEQTNQHVTRLQQVLSFPSAEQGLAAITDERIAPPVSNDDERGKRLEEDRARAVKGFQEFFDQTAHDLAAPMKAVAPRRIGRHDENLAACSGSLQRRLQTLCIIA